MRLPAPLVPQTRLPQPPDQHKHSQTQRTCGSQVRQRVRDALDLLHDAHTTYADAPVTVRKQLNRAIFAGIFLGPEPNQIRADLNEPFATITQPNNN